MSNENDEKKVNTPGTSAGSSANGAAKKKKVSVVFRSQNSKSIKELPKSLKEAAGNRRNVPSEQKAARPEAQKGPRPLPAGTKPVKPAMYGEEEIKTTASKRDVPVDSRHHGSRPVMDSNPAAGTDKISSASAGSEIKGAEADLQNAAAGSHGELSGRIQNTRETAFEIPDAADKCEKSDVRNSEIHNPNESDETRAAKKSVKQTDSPADDAAVSGDGNRKKHEPASAFESAPAPVSAAAVLNVKETPESAAGGTAASNPPLHKSSPEALKNNRSEDNQSDGHIENRIEKHAGNHTENNTDAPGKAGTKNQPVSAVNPSAPESGAGASQASEGKPAPQTLQNLNTSEPKIKIVKSYANYDASAVIAEATRNSARNAQNRGQSQKSSDGRNSQRTSRQGQTSFGQRQNAGGFSRGGFGQGTQTDRTSGGRSFGQKSSVTGDQRQSSHTSQVSGRNAVPAPSGGKNNSQRNKNSSYQSRDKKDKKDKYLDELENSRPHKTGKGAFIKPEVKPQKPEDDIKVITVPEKLTLKELADKLKLQPSIIIKKLFLQGKLVTVNTDITYEEAEEIAMAYDILCEKAVEEDVIAELLREEEDSEEVSVPRSPVVCVMGHVDHGKTSLLDAIRNTNVTTREAGGITQHIGASVVNVDDRSITFLDTPGHEAFTAMRLRGAQATDIAVLVVAADDGVKPQTIEAISHARAAGVEIVVAINKIDKPGANIDVVKKELGDQGLIPEEWGGNTPMVPVSAKTGEGIDELLEMIMLEADVMELRANPDRRARGIVIEARLDKGRGPVATVLVQKGTLNVGSNVAAGASYGKVRAMMDDKGNRIKKAGPSTPVEILGLNNVPEAGEVFIDCGDEKEARTISETYIAERKKHMLEDTKQKMNLDDLFDEIKAGNLKELPVIIKADVQGSAEAVRQSLGKLSNEEVAVKIIHSGVGNINESDVNLASAANAIIIGFNVKPDPTAKSTAEHENVDVRLYKVIYQAIDDLEAALTGMLAPVYEEKTIGHAIIRQIFKASGVGNIAGCFVTDGCIERGSKARIVRGGKTQIFDGAIASLKRFKDEVKEVKSNFECGMVFEDFGDIAVDDQIECYKMIAVPRTSKKTEG